MTKRRPQGGKPAKRAKPPKFVLWIGWGDMARKSAHAIMCLKDLGYTVIGLDVSEKPSGLAHIQPDELFLYENPEHHEKVLEIATRRGFDLMYIANPGNFHIASAMEFQHYANKIVIAKPFDTHIDFLKTIQSFEGSFYYMLSKLTIHDHYLNKPGVEFLVRTMERLHAKHNLIKDITMFLTERSSILQSEPHRLEGLKCGMLFDLAVHLISILFHVVPESISWQNKRGRFERIHRRIHVAACDTALDGAAALHMRGANTAVHGRDAETFAVVELRVEETMKHNDVETTPPPTFPVLVVVGKGVPIEGDATRDLKAIEIRFMDGAQIRLDLDTYQFAGADDKILDLAGYHNLDMRQRGINAPLIRAAEGAFSYVPADIPLQHWGAALRSAAVLFQARHLAPIDTYGYDEENAACRGLIYELLARKPGAFSDWHHLEERGYPLPSTTHYILWSRSLCTLTSWP